MATFSVHVFIAYVGALAGAKRLKHPPDPEAREAAMPQAGDNIELWMRHFPEHLFDETPQWHACIPYADGALIRNYPNLQDNLRCERPHLWEHTFLQQSAHNASPDEESFWKLSIVSRIFHELKLTDSAARVATSKGEFGPGMDMFGNFSRPLDLKTVRQAVLLYDAWGAFLQHVESLVPPNRGLKFYAYDMSYRLSTTGLCARKDGCVVACMRVSSLGIPFIACYELRSDIPINHNTDITHHSNPRDQYSMEAPKLLHFLPELAGLSPQTTADLAVIMPGTGPVSMQALHHAQRDRLLLEKKIEVSKAIEYEASFCIGTWNVGSEQQIALGLGPGVGSGGATQNDLVAGLREILQKCAAADFIAVTLQEIDDLRLPAYVKLLLGQLNQGASLSNRHYEYLGLVYAQQRSNESSVPLHVHEERIAGNGHQGVVVFAFGFADRLAQGRDIEAYSVSFGKTSFGHDTLRKAIGTSAHKGGAFIKVPALLPSWQGMVHMSVCFAGVHLDAKKPDERQKTFNLVVDYMKSETCDFVVVAGDFNPRISSDSCCPIQQMAWLLERGRDNKVTELAISQDEIRNDWRKEKWWFLHEQEIHFLPTFHKFAERSSGPLSGEEVLDDYGNTFIGPYKSENYAIKQCPGPGSLDEDGKTVFEVVSGTYHNNSNYESYWRDHACDDIKDDHICSRGIFTFDTCSHHLCYNIHDRRHCPGYTDRVFFGDARADEGDFPVQFKDKFYISLEHVSGGDHTPVVAMFSVVVDSKVSLILPGTAQHTIYDDEAWILSMQNWITKFIVWPNGSGRLCYRKPGSRLGMTSDTGCPRQESCYQIADEEQLDQIRNKTFSTTHKERVLTSVDWTGYVLHPIASSCQKNAVGTWGVCASNVQDCVTMFAL